MHRGHRNVKAGGRHQFAVADCQRNCRRAVLVGVRRNVQGALPVGPAGDGQPVGTHHAGGTGARQYNQVAGIGFKVVHRESDVKAGILVRGVGVAGVQHQRWAVIDPLCRQGHLPL